MAPRTWPWCAGTRTASASGVMTLSALFWASCSWRSEDLFGQSFSVIEPVQALRGLPCMGSFSVVRCIKCFEESPGWGLLSGLEHQALKWAPWLESYSVVQCIRCVMGQLSIVRLPMLACWERGFGDGSHLLRWLSSILLLPWLPSFSPQAFPTTISSLTSPLCLSAVSSSPCPGIVPISLNSSSQLLHLPGDMRPCLGYVWLQQGLSDSHSI